MTSRVLLVDDDEDVAGALAEVLSLSGFSTSVCSNGQEGLAFVREQPCDLILLDLDMPVMSGWEFRVAQKADASIADIPVIVLSADVSPKALAVAAESNISKPVNIPNLLLTMERLLLERERKRLATRLDQTERLALLGTIAAGVGHEVNTPLTYVVANLGLVEEDLHYVRSQLIALAETTQDLSTAAALRGLEPRLLEIDESLRSSRVGAERVALIVRNLQSLSRTDDRMASLLLSDVLASSIAMALPQITSHATLTETMDPQLRVSGNGARLGQVFVNLLVNATQAFTLSDTTKNRIDVTLKREGSHAEVSITDSGRGMSNAEKSHIFEPFFTTKRAVEGTGLGLAICRESVEAHGGSIEVESEPGQGSTFRVRLPLVLE